MNEKIYNSNKYIISNKYTINLVKIIFAFLISLRLSLLPHEIFKDRVNYLSRIFANETQFFELFSSEIPIFLNEPLFKLSSYILSFYLNPESILSLYVFINCFFVFVFVLLNRLSLIHTILALSLLLVIPYFYGGTMGAIRQGLGFDFILISLIRKDNLISKKFILNLFFASLFHVIFFVFFILVFYYKIIKKFINNDKYILFIMFLFILLVGGTWHLITPYLSSSQSYEDFEQTTSGITFLGWLVIFILFSYNYSFLKRKNKIFNESTYLFALLMFLCFIVFYWLAPGPYRILYSCIPIMVCALLNHFNKYSALCFLVTFFYGFLLLYIGAGAGSMNINFTQFLFIVFYGS